MQTSGSAQELSSAAGWEAEAADWIAWTGAELDSYASSHRAEFLPLIPAPGRLTVDLGSGEGRVSRDLEARAHRVLAIDRSPTMITAAANHPNAAVPAVLADAIALPIRSSSVDCVVAFMCLHDFDELELALAEVGRILTRTGKLVVAITHPLASAGRFADGPDQTTRPFVIDNSYSEVRRSTVTRARGGRTMTYHGRHRPLQSYTDAITGAGLVIERLREVSSADPTDKWHRVPTFLHLLAGRR